MVFFISCGLGTSVGQCELLKIRLAMFSLSHTKGGAAVNPYEPPEGEIGPTQPLLSPWKLRRSFVYVLLLMFALLVFGGLLVFLLLNMAARS